MEKRDGTELIVHDETTPENRDELARALDNEITALIKKVLADPRYQRIGVLWTVLGEEEAIQSMVGHFDAYHAVAGLHSLVDHVMRELQERDPARLAMALLQDKKDRTEAAEKPFVPNYQNAKKGERG